jgi:HNH endonuclease
MRRSIRTQVAARAEHCCEYCGWPDWLSPVSFAVEHIHPQVHGGTDDLENLAYACPGCNGFKHEATEVLDLITGSRAALFHPRQDVWEDHFMWNDDRTEMIGISPTGRVTVRRLRLNREEVLNIRLVLPLFPRPAR